MKILKYTFSTLLLIWGVLSIGVKLFSDGLHFPFLTLITGVALVIGIGEHKRADSFFLISACLWIVFSAETIGFVIFFDASNYGRMIIGFIPLLLSLGVYFSTNAEFKLINNLAKKLLLVPLFISIGIGSYAYKPTTEEINCWYYFDSGNTYKVLFAEAPERTFEVELSSEELKNEVKAEALQYEERNGYYCPETKVRVVTRFGKIVSAKILSFRNSEIDKNVKFSSQIEIPLQYVNGDLEILKPFILRMWN
ncbi:hypothetical protein [Rufibacter ruber]|uniref:hypothetical protein n=1 Tax=Rufibacter ruber TaxID=1783499 RepID=UPI0008345166|nr:hypothetical protein [Rufibacter ruber]